MNDQRHDTTTPRNEPSKLVDEVAADIVEAAFRVHRALGPGLLERVYEACLFEELKAMGRSPVRQVPVSIRYRDIILDEGLRLDLLVDNLVIVELKAVEQVLPVHKAQVATYLRLALRPLGLLINFNVPLLKNGIQRILP